MGQASESHIQVARPHILIVEGNDEVRWFGALLGHMGLPHPPQLVPLGKSGFRRRLRNFVKAAAPVAGPRRLSNQTVPRKLTRIGIVRDADENPAGAFQSVRDAVAAVGLEPPAAHRQFSAGSPRIGIFIMPDITTHGALETLCRQSVEREPVGKCVLDYLACLDRLRGGAASPAAQRDKSFVHTWLASGDNPVARVGEGAEQGAWDFNDPIFAPITDFVQQVQSP